MYIVGQKRVKDSIRQLENYNFIIIKGGRQYGKTFLTRFIARELGMDYMLLDNKVDTIRKLVDSSYYNNNCVYHFKDFERASNAAKAALLKITEETPKGIKIIITINSMNFLDTLISRAYVITMEEYTKEELYEYKELLSMNDEMFEKLYVLGIKTPTTLKEFQSIGTLETLIEMVDTVINNILNKSFSLQVVTKTSNYFKYTYLITECDEARVFLILLEKALLKTKMQGMVRRVQACETGLVNIYNNPGINRKIVVNESLLEMM